ncbi:MAG: toll/interleukin-1 receptor domain-containing protein [bacterium]|nr:toll/interleukin-1 receptor domain-containing protein [bacterium]
MDVPQLILIGIGVGIVILLVVAALAAYLTRRGRGASTGSTPPTLPNLETKQKPDAGSAFGGLDRQPGSPQPPKSAARPSPLPAPPAPLPRPVTPPAPEPEAEPTRGIALEERRRAEAEREKDITESRRPVDPGLDDDSETAVMPAPGGREPSEFTAYYPKEVVPNTWYDLLAYVYRVSAAGLVAADAQGELGSQIRDYRRVARPEQSFVADNAAITVTPRIAGFQVNPVSATIGFFDAWNRADFKVRANAAAQVSEVHEGAITFSIDGVIVCDVPLFIEVNPAAAAPVSGTPISQPTATPITHAEPRKIYRAVFCSYSRKDVRIIERVERAYKILGDAYYRDLTTLRAGEAWDQRLLELIEQADIFQLFWSSHSATSNAVRKEWTKALEVAARKPGFIRPVFWEQPMPAPPPELGHLNFAFEPTLDD